MQKGISLMLKKMLIKKRILWRHKFELNGSLAHENYAKKCKLVIEKYQARKEMSFLRVKKKKFFTFVNNRLRSKKTNLLHMKNKNGTKDTDPSIITESFLNKIQSYFTHDDGVLAEFHVNHSVTDSLEYVDFTPQIVSKHMFSMNRQASAGPDVLPGYFWFSMRDSACLPLSIIYNKSMLTDKLPDMWKKSIITPIFKKGDPTIYSNYRPVALTSVARKIMESILRDYILDYLLRHKLLNKSQHGFLKGHSTGCQLLECFDVWSRSFENSRNMDVCYIDFSKAFYSVSVPKLIHKLKAYGLRGNLINWHTDYLTRRTYCVRAENTLLEEVEQISGVPEGSVLRPICFVLFINDLPYVVKNSVCKMYADDVILHCIFDDDKSCDGFQADIHEIAIWELKWQLVISLEKTVILHIGKKNSKREYNLNSINISSITSVKDLGIRVSNDLSWRLHCTEKTKRASKVANIILHSFSTHCIDVYVKAFNVYLMPILEYCCFLWSPVYINDMTMIENVLQTFTG